MGYCLNALMKMLEKSSASDRRIIQYIIDNPMMIPSLGIEALSVRTNTSYSTISRFCKKMGFDGFKDLKQQLLTDIEDDYGQYSNEYIDNYRDFQRIKREMNDLYFKILKDSQKNLQEDVFIKAAVAIIEASEVYIIGQGTSSVSARYAYLKFLPINRMCANDSDATVIKTKCSMLKKGSLLFAVSSSGRTKSIVEAASLAKKAGATVISLTDYYTSPLSNISDIKLCTTFRDCTQHMREDFPLVIGQLSLIDILQAVCMSEINDIQNIFKTIKEKVQTEKIL